jgi:hypothetical protein
MLGGVHGKNEQKVFAELCVVVEEWIGDAEKEKESLPPGMAGKLDRLAGRTLLTWCPFVVMAEYPIASGINVGRNHTCDI